ncbi:MAG: HisA/HisF-related TIM barrel protein [Thermoplasmatota archaeon]
MFRELDTPKGIEIIPSVAVMGFTPVWVKEGMYNPVKVDGTQFETVPLSKMLLNRYGKMHYLDILGIRKGVVEWNLFQSVASLEGEIWADMGVVYSDGLIDVIMAGAHGAVISTKMIASLEEIASSLELTENVILQIDHDEGIISKDRDIRNMSVKDLVEEMSAFGLGTFILDDIRQDRKRVDGKLIETTMEALPEGGELYVGIEETEELPELEGSGIKGVLISSSRLLEGIG